MRPLKPGDVVRGQYSGYRKEPGVAKNSDVETFARCGFSSTRGAGRECHGTCAQASFCPRRPPVIVQLKPPPQRYSPPRRQAAGRANYYASGCPQTPPCSRGARQARGKEFVGNQRELYLIDERPGEEAPYERLLDDAMAGNSALFTREDAVEAAWAVVDPVLKNHHRVRPYQRHSWGPKEADTLISADGCWYNPGFADAASD